MIQKVIRGFSYALVLVGVLGVGYSVSIYIKEPDAGQVAVDSAPPPPVEPPSPVLIERAKKKPAVKPKPIPMGSKMAKVRIPKLGITLNVRQGMRDQDIAKDLGHYPESALPGEVGNFVLAGHRVVGILWDIDDLKAGDEILVKYNGKTYVYKVYKRYVVNPDSVEITYPVPGSKAAPNRPVMTMFSCLKTGNHKREVVHAYLSEIR